MEEDTDAPTAAEAQAQQVRSSAHKKGIRGHLSCCPMAPSQGGLAWCRQHAMLLSQHDTVQKTAGHLDQPRLKKFMLRFGIMQLGKLGCGADHLDLVRLSALRWLDKMC